MDDNYIIEKGYYEFSPPATKPDSVVRAFQKRFDDETGKKYFITVYKWDWSRFYREDMPIFSYEIETQLYKKDSHYPIDLTFFSGWNIDEVEEHLEKMWNTEDYDYYEEFD